MAALELWPTDSTILTGEETEKAGVSAMDYVLTEERTRRAAVTRPLDGHPRRAPIGERKTFKGAPEAAQDDAPWLAFIANEVYRSCGRGARRGR